MQGGTGQDLGKLIKYLKMSVEVTGSWMKARLNSAALILSFHNLCCIYLFIYLNWNSLVLCLSLQLHMCFKYSFVQCTWKFQTETPTELPFLRTASKTIQMQKTTKLFLIFQYSELTLIFPCILSHTESIGSNCRNQAMSQKLISEMMCSGSTFPHCFSRKKKKVRGKKTINMSPMHVLACCGTDSQCQCESLCAIVVLCYCNTSN